MRLSLHGEYLARSPVADTDRLWRHTASRAKVQWFSGTFSLTDATNCNHVCREHNACGVRAPRQAAQGGTIVDELFFFATSGNQMFDT